MAVLNVWMNGELVGEWSTLRTGTPVLRYAEQWVASPRARALSLSLPITADREIRGAVVDNYFENLLPDSVEIRRRMRTRFSARSLSPFDLLSAAGRDCVGAVQLLPPDLTPAGWDRIDATELSESQVEQELRRVVTPALGQEDDGNEDFRISLAGAQEKTALLYMGGRWFRPRGATPTTHLLKLPLGLIGGFRGDFTDSVENEWFCAQLLRELGLPVADAEIATFGAQRVLVVARFDRSWVGVEPDSVRRSRFQPKAGQWIARLPQEDFCQASGLPPNQKYEADGGPSIHTGLSILAGGEDPRADKTTFALAQLAFWLLAATDGHAKNFSLHHMSGGRYRMTPLYDVISAWPVIGRGASQLAQPKVRLAMSLRGTRPHYKLNEINARHWRALALRTGVGNVWDRMIELAETVDAAIERVRDRLPKKFPDRVAAAIATGARKQAKRFLLEAR